MALKDLLVKNSEIGEAAMEKILKPFVQFVDNGELAFNSSFYDLNADDKISIVLIAKDSWRFIEGKENFAGGMKNEELEKMTLLPGNTVRPVIKRLRDKGLIRTEKSVHFPTAKLLIAQDNKKPKK